MSQAYTASRFNRTGTMEMRMIAVRQAITGGRPVAGGTRTITENLKHYPLVDVDTEVIYDFAHKTGGAWTTANSPTA